MNLDLNRRAFLATGGLAAFGAALGVATPSEAIVIGDGDEKKNVEVVNAMLEAWSTGDPDKVASFFTDDAAFRGAAHILDKDRPASKGRDGIRAAAAAFLKTAKVKMVVYDTFARGSFVVNSHHQLFEMNDPAQGQREDWYFGSYFLKNGKIQEWNDYAFIPFNQPREVHSPQFGKFLRI
jgi:uncharacterized protein (TIGR02246 family)